MLNRIKNETVISGNTIEALADNVKVYCSSKEEVVIHKVGSNVNIRCDGTLIFIGTVGHNVEIQCRKAPTFLGDVGNNITIECDDEPTFLAKVGTNMRVNKKNGTVSKNIAVNGDLVVGAGARVEVVATMYSFMSPLKESKESYIKDRYSEEMQKYLSSFDKGKKLTDTIKELKLSLDEVRDLESCWVKETYSSLNIPVRLEGRLYDLESLISNEINGKYFNGKTGKYFFLRDIQPANDIREIIDEKLKAFISKREVVVVGLSHPPGGPRL